MYGSQLVGSAGKEHGKGAHVNLHKIQVLDGPLIVDLCKN